MLNPTSSWSNGKRLDSASFLITNLAQYLTLGRQDIAEFVLPGVLDAFLKGQSRNLKKWFGEAAYNRINIAIRERKSEGSSIACTIIHDSNRL